MDIMGIGIGQQSCQYFVIFQWNNPFLATKTTIFTWQGVHTSVCLCPQEVPDTLQPSL